MLKIVRDTRIFLNVLSNYSTEPDLRRVFREYDAEFANEPEFVHFLARNTETFGYKDPARWENEYIHRQRLCETDKCNYGYAFGHDVFAPRDVVFYDADKRILDAKDYWACVVAMVRAMEAGILSDTPMRYFRYRKRQYRHHHAGTQYYRNAKIGRVIRKCSFAETFEDGEGNPVYTWSPRKEDVLLRNYYWARPRSRRSTGWKEQKCRKQWEHNQVMQETHKKNAARKAAKRGLEILS